MVYLFDAFEFLLGFFGEPGPDCDFWTSFAWVGSWRIWFLPSWPFLIRLFCFSCKFFWLSSWYPKSKIYLCFFAWYQQQKMTYVVSPQITTHASEIKIRLKRKVSRSGRISGLFDFGTLICILLVLFCVSSYIMVVDRVEFEFLMAVLFFEHICIYLCCVYFVEVFSFSF